MPSGISEHHDPFEQGRVGDSPFRVEQSDTVIKRGAGLDGVGARAGNVSFSSDLTALPCAAKANTSNFLHWTNLCINDHRGLVWVRHLNDLKTLTNGSLSHPSVFVHASPRSGSTYFFHVLRRNTALMCFNEALLDRRIPSARFIKADQGENVASSKLTSWNVNHNFLDRPDDEELIEAWDKVMHLYPPAPAFCDYLPPNGALSDDVRSYLSGLEIYANAKGKRAVFCEINSRGRAGALRDSFGGFHAAQIRDPISQFGSFYRPLEEAGEWAFLAHPLKELGISGHHPLYEIVPPEWRPPVLPWPAADRARRWATAAEYVLLLADQRPATPAKIFRWHMFAWLLSNVAAIAYSDFVLDIDRAHDDAAYRSKVMEVFASATGTHVDFSDLTKFTRYYQFETFDMTAVASQAVTVVHDALADGRLEKALSLLALSPLKTSAGAAATLLFTKIEDSLASFTASTERRFVSNERWAELAAKHALPWSLVKSRMVRESARMAYPLLAPMVRTVRKMF